ncbi:hypothetical protein ES703_125331 [subsurface metagenome]
MDDCSTNALGQINSATWRINLNENKQRTLAGSQKYCIFKSFGLTYQVNRILYRKSKHLVLAAEMIIMDFVIAEVKVLWTLFVLNTHLCLILSCYEGGIAIEAFTGLTVCKRIAKAVRQKE